MRLSIPFALSLVLAAGCGDDKKPETPIDSMKPPIDGRPDPSLMNKEGGEIRLEWISQGGVTTSRMGAYFYKSMDPGRFDLPAFPGCVDMRARDHWPLAQGTIVPLDVGGVKLTPTTGTPFDMVKAMNTSDAFKRPHALWWNKAPNQADPDDADKYLPPNQSYDIELAGSAEWPHQVFAKAAFMPERWTPTSPNATETAVLTRDQDFTFTYTPVTSSNLPPGVKVNTFMAFAHSVNGPIVACQEEGTDGSMTVPAALVNIIIDNAGPNLNGEVGHPTPLPADGTSTARMVRQQLTHQLFELTNSDTPVDEASRKRVDVLTIYCYNNAWRVAQ
jgi:hypothetical protein